MTAQDRRPVFLDRDGLYVFEDGSPTPMQPIDLRKTLVGVVVTVVLIIAIPLVAGFGAYRSITNHAIQDNENLVRQLNSERIARTKAINEFIYQQCVQAEVRDVVIVQQLRAALVRVRTTLPEGSPLRADQEQTLLDGINALEPEDEPDCRPPAATKPKGQTP